MPDFFHNNCPKNIPNFRGHVPPTPVSYAYI